MAFLLISCKSTESKNIVLPVDDEDLSISDSEIFSDNIDKTEVTDNNSEQTKKNDKELNVYEPEIISFSDIIFTNDSLIPAEPQTENYTEQFSENELSAAGLEENKNFYTDENELVSSVLEPDMQNHSDSKQKKKADTSVKKTENNNKKLPQTNITQGNHKSSQAFTPEPEVTVAFNLSNKPKEDKTEYNDAAKCHNLAGLEFKKKNYNRSLELTDYYLLHFTEYLDEMLFLKGQILEILSVDGNGDIIQAKDCYEKLVKLYPQSKWYIKAHDRIKYIDRFYFNVW